MRKVALSSVIVPRHARRSGVAPRPGWAAEQAPTRPRPERDRPGPRPPARFDPLIHPVAITEQSVIGDQLRVPATWCDMPGCGVSFAHPAALGEADNRARAATAGWGADTWGRLVCPSCQRHHRHMAPVRRVS
ncbi:MAG TPA: hypothetical protein VGS62_01135 [Streptosporangiaceae bacterium]|nr:hypothetical protein [Streptosporangiaceae bacterium]